MQSHHCIFRFPISIKTSTNYSHVVKMIIQANFSLVVFIDFWFSDEKLFVARKMSSVNVS